MFDSRAIKAHKELLADYSESNFGIKYRHTYTSLKREQLYSMIDFYKDLMDVVTTKERLGYLYNCFSNNPYTILEENRIFIIDEYVRLDNGDIKMLNLKLGEDSFMLTIDLSVLIKSSIIEVIEDSA